MTYEATNYGRMRVRRDPLRGIAEPLTMFRCHCRGCQRASGGGGNYVVIVPADAFRFTRGAPATILRQAPPSGTISEDFALNAAHN